MKQLIIALALVLAGAPLAAQDESASFSLGGDQYQAGQSVSQTTELTGDVFMAGETVSVTAPAGGSAHLLGRRITISDTVGENIYAAGQSISVTAPVLGNATVFGQDVSISAPVSGNLRAMGQNVKIDADVAGSSILGGETIVINANLAGDVSLTGDTITFGDAARIGGELNLYHSASESFEIPVSVISADRIIRHELSTDASWTDHTTALVRPTFWSKAKAFFGFTIVVAVAASILAAVFPNFVSGAREAALAKPVRTTWMGFLALSATAGSLIFLALTGIGLLLVPVSIFLTLLLWFLGYVVGAYVLGVALIKAIGRGVPDDLFDRAIAALIGAIALGLLAMVPFLGWWVILAMTWIGAGAVITRLFRPGFYTDTV
ncbi:MAG: hypothetical protein V3U96_03500 [Paracoccaceae bacterium]